MDEPVDIGSITISYYIGHDGDMISGVSVEGDLPMITRLGLLRMAEDTILRMDEDDE